MVWWCRVGSRKRGWWVSGQKSETELLELGFGCAVGNGGGGRWGDVVGWYLQGSGGVVVPHLVAQVGAVSFSPKVENRAAGARFRVRRWKWRLKAMG